MTYSAAAAAPRTTPAMDDRGAPDRAFAITAWVLSAGVFFASYTTWRVAFDYLYTISDVLFCLGALLLIGCGRLNLRPFGGLTILWYGGLLLMLASLLASSIVNGSPARWFIVAAQYAFSFGLLPMLLAQDGRQVMQRFVLALVLGVTSMELFAAVVYFTIAHDYQTAQLFGFEFITGSNRLGAFTADANWNAAVIAMTMPFVFYLARIGRFRLLATTICIGILGLGLLLTGSVTGFVSAFFASGFFLLVAGEWRIVRASALLATIVAVLVSLGAIHSLPEAFQRRVASAIEQGDVSQAGTYVGREALIEEAWQLVDQTMLVGMGVDQFRVDSVDRMPVHNMYLLVWAEGGVFSLIGWLMMMTLPIILSLYGFARDRGTAGLGLAVTFVFIAFSMAAPHMYSRSWSVPLIIAMAVIVQRLRSGTRHIAA